MLEATRALQSKDIPPLSHPDSLDEPPVTLSEAGFLKWKKPRIILLAVKLPEIYLTRLSNV